MHAAQTSRRIAALGASVVATLACVAAVACFVLFGLGPHTGAYRTLSVLSGSMTPTFRPGDVVIDTPMTGRDLRVGQVVTYQVPEGDHQVVSHRVVEIVEAGAHPTFRTKGDANPAADPWTARMTGSTMWRQRAVVPYAGTAIGFVRRSASSRWVTLSALGLFVLFGVQAIWRADGGGDAAEGDLSGFDADDEDDELVAVA